MTQDQAWERIEQIFHQALEQPPEARDAWLESACAGDPGLHAEVASLLESDRAAGADPVGANVRQAVLDLHKEEVAKPAMEGRLVGHWRLIRELGQGGMGTVYLAARADRQYESQAADQAGAPGAGHRFHSAPFSPRKADSRAPGTSQHHEDVRRGDHRRRDSLSRDGVHRGRLDHALRRRTQTERGGTHSPVPAGMRRRGVRSPQFHRSSRSEARQYPDRCQRRSEAAGFRHFEIAAIPISPRR